MNKAPSEPPATEAIVGRRRAFWSGVGLFILWLGGLVALVITSSNPVTVNVAQLLEADSIVVADLTNPDTGEFELEAKIFGEDMPDQFRVLQFEEIIPVEGNRWLMALHQERAGNYSVVPVPYRDRELLLVYPGDEATIAQARQALDIR